MKRLRVPIRVSAVRAAVACALAMIHLCAHAVTVGIAIDAEPGPSARHGIAKVREALEKKGIVIGPADRISAQILAGRGNRDEAFVLAAGIVNKGTATTVEQGINVYQNYTDAIPESFRIRTSANRRVVTVIGGDDVGLMYGLLEMAEWVGWSDDAEQPFKEVRETTQEPALAVRGVSVYTMQRRYWESRFYDEAYWTRYFDMLAENRFNSFTIIFGYENGGFLAPAYPYFFDVAAFPDVKMVGLSAEAQAKNLAALKRVIALAHERGIKVTLGLWDHIYRGGVQAGGVAGAEKPAEKPTEGLVWGVTSENLLPYSVAALTRLLELVPEVDGLQFRMHGESGLKKEEIDGFWREVFATIKKLDPDLSVDARAKGVPDSVIDAAAEMGINLTVSTKYWMEQLGMPFHPTHVNPPNQRDRRHGYADLLTYPKRYDVLWQLWNGGTNRVLLWGDPEYARRFAASAKLYDGAGFVVNEPLATKMEAQPHDAEPFALLNEKYRHTDYEFERYWHFYQVFGRLGYDPETPSELWDREFVWRFGKAGPHVERGLHLASGVLPRIVGACYPYRLFPTTRGWAERQRLGDLPEYAKNEGSDTELFESFSEAAARLENEGETAKVTPYQTGLWLAKRSVEINRAVKAAEDAAKGDADAEGDKEFAATLVDLKILARLALFHAHRAAAAVAYNRYVENKDSKYLQAAIIGERAAVADWKGLVEAAGDLYAEDLMFGTRDRDLCGHWRDEVAPLEKGLAALEAEWEKLAGKPLDPMNRADLVSEMVSGPGPRATIESVERARAGEPLKIRVKVGGQREIRWVRLRYRPVTQFEEYRTLEMARAEEAGMYEATVPGEAIRSESDFMFFVESMDRQGNGGHYPDFEEAAPYVIVKVARDGVAEPIKQVAGR